MFFAALQIAAKFGASLPDSGFVALVERCLCDLPDNPLNLAIALPLADTLAGADRGAAVQQLAFDALLRVASRCNHALRLPLSASFWTMGLNSFQ